jgi:hypothetical protein
MSTDQITQHVATKLTKSQKRSTKATIAEAIDIFADQSVGPTKPRSKTELLNAQLNLADMALEKADPQEWLSDVLDALGLRQEIIERDKARREPCWPYAGTRRGVSLHLRTYSHFCPACASTRQEHLAAKRALLGLDEGVIINERS